jgi:hypothetical protein
MDAARRRVDQLRTKGKSVKRLGRSIKYERSICPPMPACPMRALRSVNIWLSTTAEGLTKLQDGKRLIRLASVHCSNLGCRITKGRNPLNEGSKLFKQTEPALHPHRNMSSGHGSSISLWF